MNPYDIIRKPRISEKTVHLQNKFGQYTFEVHPSANKTQIKEAIKSLWKVDVLAVNTQNYDGKPRRMRNNKQPGVTASWKKAIVRLADGQKIEGI
ncbi:MAG: 50S ribosomal protein L23 [Planctomycetes bacterium]|jgi:large subunit ribosomal protein L23|nr:50S ribosomal protein L23 [Planctomycetota bacterium]